MKGISARSRKAKGRRNEKRSQEWLEARGYRVVRAAGSKGVFDLWGASPESPQLVLLQVKTGRIAPREELERMAEFPHGEDTIRLLHVWMPMAREPECWLVAAIDTRADGTKKVWLDPYPWGAPKAGEPQRRWQAGMDKRGCGVSPHEDGAGAGGEGGERSLWNQPLRS